MATIKSIEEKAKAYDKLFVKAQQIYNKENDVLILHTIEDLFPELKESEDERIRKEIISMSQTLGKTEWIAWLEKQGEHANFCNKIQIGDKVTRNEEGVLVNLSQLKRVAKPEQKPVVSLDENGEPILTDFESALFTTISYFWQSYNSGEEINIAEFAKEYAPELLEAANKQLKPEWSEEDEYNVAFIVETLLGLDGDKEYSSKYKSMANWLKSLRPQKQWKPTEEQLRELHCVISGCSYETPVLVELEKQLKNLL